MRTVFLIGNIASGKSTASRYLESKGAERIDLDRLAKSLYVPGSHVVNELACEFGPSILDPRGGIDTAALARVAFSSPERTSRLSAITHPYVLHALQDRLFDPSSETHLKVVEVTAPADFVDAFVLADLVVTIAAPLAVRRARAIERGMDPADFDARAAAQPSDAVLDAMADVRIDNTAADDSLFQELDRIVLREGL